LTVNDPADAQHDNLRDNVGQAIADYAAEHTDHGGNVGIDWCSAHDIDPLADKIMELIGAQQAAPEAPTLTAERVRKALTRHLGWLGVGKGENSWESDVAAICADLVAPDTQKAGAAVIDRDWTEDAAHENGNYQCLCSTCGNTFIGHKRRVTCKACAAATTAGAPAVSCETALTADEADFVLKVLRSPGCKISDWSANGQWKRPEELGLVTCCGSWKWQPTPKLIDVLRVALTQQAGAAVIPTEIAEAMHMLKAFRDGQCSFPSSVFDKVARFMDSLADQAQLKAELQKQEDDHAAMMRARLPTNHKE